MIYSVIGFTDSMMLNLYVGDEIHRAIRMIQADPNVMVECWKDGEQRYLVRTVPDKELIEVAYYADGNVSLGEPLVISKLDHYPIKEFGYSRVIHTLTWGAR